MKDYQIMTKRPVFGPLFGLSADFITEYNEQTINEVQILAADGLKIMVSFQELLVAYYLARAKREITILSRWSH